MRLFYVLNIAISLIFNFSIKAYEKADAFIVEANPESYKVLSPVKIKKTISVIVKNKMFSTLRVKLTSEELGDLKSITIKQSESESVDFDYKKSDRYFIVPISPPFQRVELKVGQKSYEIPEKE